VRAEGGESKEKGRAKYTEMVGGDQKSPPKKAMGVTNFLAWGAGEASKEISTKKEGKKKEEKLMRGSGPRYPRNPSLN